MSVMSTQSLLFNKQIIGQIENPCPSSYEGVDALSALSNPTENDIHENIFKFFLKGSEIPA